MASRRNGDDGIFIAGSRFYCQYYRRGRERLKELPASTNAFQKLYAGPLSLPLMFDQLFADAFLAKLDPTGSKLMWLTYLGGQQ